MALRDSFLLPGSPVLRRKTLTFRKLWRRIRFRGPPPRTNLISEPFEQGGRLVRLVRMSPFSPGTRPREKRVRREFGSLLLMKRCVTVFIIGDGQTQSWAR